MKRTASSLGVVFTVCVIALLAGCNRQSSHAAAAATTSNSACPGDDSGLTLPSGFCATVFADDIGHARHMAVAQNGVVYVNTWSGSYYGNHTPHSGGFLVALQDTKGTGKADVLQRFGETSETGGHGGTGIGIYNGAIYAENNDAILRYALPANSIVPNAPAEKVVSGLPLGGDHPMHPFIIASDGAMYVDVATATNACQQRNRMPKSPGINPCTELETRGGVWRYDANKTNQTFSPAARYATGIRNAEGLAFDQSGRLFATQHGRDQLHANWPDLYKPEEEATLPAEELLLLKDKGDYGWPYCYYDNMQQKLVLAPEYGGNGGKAVGVCASKLGPAAAFPAHWAPNAMTYYDKTQFPDHYRHGVFIAFHGSWDRAPYPQGGYNVVFQPLDGDHASGACEVFADGFAGASRTPGKAEHRPSGVAVGPDGALYVSDDIRGRIYRIVYRGGANFNASNLTRCPSDGAPPAKAAGTTGQPPEGTNPNAGAAAAQNLPVPKGSTRQMVELGRRIYRGEIAEAGCTGCHGDNGEGTTLGPALDGKKWLWSDGSITGIRRTIVRGVPHPKEFRSPMPPEGGVRLTPEQLSALTAYVWALGHSPAANK